MDDSIDAIQRSFFDYEPVEKEDSPRTQQKRGTSSNNTKKSKECSNDSRISIEQRIAEEFSVIKAIHTKVKYIELIEKTKNPEWAKLDPYNESTRYPIAQAESDGEKALRIEFMLKKLNIL